MTSFDTATQKIENETEELTEKVAAGSEREVPRVWAFQGDNPANDTDNKQDQWIKSRLLDAGLKAGESLSASVGTDTTNSADFDRETANGDGVFDQTLSPIERPSWIGYATYAAVFFSFLWIGLCVFLAIQTVGWTQLGQLLPHEFGGLIAGALAPVALFWLAFGFALRADDARVYGEALRAELQALIFPSSERTQRVSNDIQRLCEQAAELATSSKTVLKAIYVARQGLQTEMRNYAALTQKTEFHIERLTDTLNSRIEAVNNTIISLEARIAKVDEVSALALQSWKEASSAVIAQADSFDGLFEQAAQKILLAADKASEKTGTIKTGIESSFDGLETTIERLGSRVDNISTGFDRQVVRLKDSAETVGQEVTRLADTIESSVASFEGTTRNAVEAMAQSSQSLMDQRNALAGSIETFIEHSHRLSDTVSVNLEALNRSGSILVEKTDAIEQRLSAQTTRIEDALQSVTYQSTALERAGDAAATKLQEALSLAISGADTIAQSVRRAGDSITRMRDEASSHMREMVNTTENDVVRMKDILERANIDTDRLKEIVDDLQQGITEGLAKAQGEYGDLNADAQKTLAALEDSAAILMSRFEHVKEQLSTPFFKMETVLQDADRNFAKIDETLAKRMQTVQAVINDASASAEKIRDTLQNHALELSGTSGQIASHLKGIESVITGQSSLVRTVTSEVCDRFDRIETVFTQNTHLLEERSQKALSDLETVATAVKTHALDMDATVSNTTKTMNSVEDSIEKATLKVQESALKAGDSLNEIAQNVLRVSSDTDHAFHNLVSQADILETRMEKLKASYETTTQSNLEKLKQTGIVFDQSLQDLKQGSEDAAEVLKLASLGLSSATEEIRSASTKVSNDLDAIGKQFDQQRHDLLLAGDQAVMRTDRLREALDQQFRDLSAAVGRSMAELESAADKFMQTSDIVARVTDKAQADLETTGETAHAQSEKLSASAQEVLELTQQLIKTLKEEAASLLSASSQSLIEIKRMGDSFSIRAAEMDEHVKSAASTSQRYGQELKTQAKSLSEVSAETCDAISAQISQLQERARDVARISDDVKKQLEDTKGCFTEEAASFRTISDHAIERAEEAAHAYNRQSSVLLKASEDLRHQLDQIKNLQIRAQRDQFLNSTKFIFETLHSLSVDFSRLMDQSPQDQDRLWKLYQKGDLAAFTRAFVENMDMLPLDKVRGKYMQDHEFRNYAQRFFRMFEELLTDSYAIPQGELMATGFLTSHLGQLYTRLCIAVGRQPREVSVRESVKAEG